MKPVRLGSYGDPFAIPPHIWGDLFKPQPKGLKWFVPKKTLGYVLFEGVSHLGPDPIVVIANTFQVASNNEKIGDMIQVWIMLRDIAPQKAAKVFGLAKSVCGNCAYRHDKGGLCYVTLFRAPRAIWEAYQLNKYSRDPNGISIVANAIQNFGHTSYSESAIRFLNSKDPTLKEHALNVAKKSMLSAKSKKESLRLNALGFKTFRPVENIEDLLAHENLCAADRLGLTCRECMQCHGVDADQSHGVIVHGTKKNGLTQIGGSR